MYFNKGAATKGTDNDTSDRFGKKYVDRLILALTNGTYTPKSVRREYIRKQNGKLRPLGIPSFRTSCCKMLFADFWNLFMNRNSTIFPTDSIWNGSCHTALKQAKSYFTGTKWFIEGDIKGCFDDIDHTVFTLSEEKTLITHSAEKVHFLGYNVSVRRSQEVKTDSNGRKKKTLNGSVKLTVPPDKIERLMFDKGIIKQTDAKKFHPIHRSGWLYLPDYEILAALVAN